VADTITVTETNYTISVTPPSGNTVTITEPASHRRSTYRQAQQPRSWGHTPPMILPEGSTNLYHDYWQGGCCGSSSEPCNAFGVTPSQTPAVLLPSRVTNAGFCSGTGIGFDAAARAAVSTTGTGLSYNSSTGVITSLMTSTATSTKGIANTNVLECNANVADDDFLRIDGTAG
jgi:hypothetical protein